MSKRESLARVMMKSGLLPMSARFISRELTILAFHRIGTPTADYSGDRSLYSINFGEFQRLLELCQRQFDVVPLSDIAKHVRLNSKPKRPAVAITFDDGYQDNFEAAELLEKKSLPATFFICPGLVNDPHTRWWDTIAALPKHSELLKSRGLDNAAAALGQIKTSSDSATQPFMSSLREYSRQYIGRSAHQIMNWDQIRSLHQRGFEIGAHSLTHRVLASLPAAEQQHEIIESKNLLELHLDSPVKSFAYPVGGPTHYQVDTAKMVDDAGFSTAVTYGLDQDWKHSQPLSHLTIPRLAAAGSANLIFGSIIGLWKYDQ